MPVPKLLIADDALSVRRIVEFTFANRGVEVLSAETADEAMQKFIDDQPDIVLIDAGLEGTSGYSICEMIKGDDASRHIPVLLLIGTYEPFDQTEAERVCADGFLTKPFASTNELVTRVFDMIGILEVDNSKLAVDLGVPSEEIGVESSSEAEIEVESLSEAETTSLEESSDVEDDKVVTDEVDPETEPDVRDVEPTGSGGEFPDELSDSVQEVAEPQAVRAEPQDPFEFPVYDDDPKADLADIESLYERSFADTVEIDEFDTVDDMLGDASLDDDLIEASYPAAGIRGIEDREFDWSDASIIATIPDVTLPTEDDEKSVTPSASAKTEDLSVDLSKKNDSTDRLSLRNEIEPAPGASPELIEMIAQRVIDRLSDRVIREVAKDAVPEIAERLIREALEEQPKQV